MSTFHDLDPVVQKQINANPRLKSYEGVYLSTPAEMLFNAGIRQNFTINLEKQA